MRVVGTRFDVVRAQSKTIVVMFDAPPKSHIELIPSSRIPPMPFDVPGRRTDDAQQRLIAI